MIIPETGRAGASERAAGLRRLNRVVGARTTRHGGAHVEPVAVIHKEAPPAKDSGGWVLSPHRVWDSHIPECFPYVRFSTNTVPAGG